MLSLVWCVVYCYPIVIWMIALEMSRYSNCTPNHYFILKMIKYIQSVFFLHFYLPLELNKITVLIKWNLSTDACLNTIPFTKSVSIDAAELEFSIQVLFFLPSQQHLYVSQVFQCFCSKVISKIRSDLFWTCKAKR